MIQDDNGPLSEERLKELTETVNESTHDAISLCTECMQHCIEKADPELMSEFLEVNGADTTKKRALIMAALCAFMGKLPSFYEAQKHELPDSPGAAFRKLRGSMVICVPKDPGVVGPVMVVCDDIWITNDPDEVVHTQSRH